MRSIFVKQMIRPVNAIIGRIIMLCVELGISRAPSDEGGVGAVGNRTLYTTSNGVQKSTLICSGNWELRNYPVACGSALRNT